MTTPGAKRPELVSLKGYDILAAGVVASKPYGGLHGFRTGIRKEEATKIVGHNVAECFNELQQLIVFDHAVLAVNEPSSLALNRFHNSGMAVTGGCDSDAGSEIEILAAFSVDEKTTSTRFDD